MKGLVPTQKLLGWCWASPLSFQSPEVVSSAPPKAIVGSSGAHIFLIHTPTLSLEETCSPSIACIQGYLLSGPTWLTPPLTRSLGVYCGHVPPLCPWLRLRALGRSIPWTEPKPARVEGCSLQRKEDVCPPCGPHVHPQAVWPSSRNHHNSLALPQILLRCTLPLTWHTRSFNRDTPDTGAVASSIQDATAQELVNCCFIRSLLIPEGGEPQILPVRAGQWALESLGHFSLSPTCWRAKQEGQLAPN